MNTSRPHQDIEHFLKVLKVPFVSKWLKDSIDIAQFHDFKQVINQIFDQMNINNLVVQIPSDQLDKIPLPAMALMKNKALETITKVNNGVIHMEASTHPSESISEKEFTRQWSGYMVLTETGPLSGQPEYEQYQKALFYKYFYPYLFSAVLLISMIFLLINSSISLTYIGLAMIKIIGVGVCGVLIRRTYDDSNSSINKLCSVNRAFNCTDVISSGAASIWGVKMSEIGLFYFGGTLIAILVMAIIQQLSALYIVLVLFTGINLCYAAFSIYYQKMVIGKWCPLCLVTLGLFVLEALVLGVSYNGTVEISTQPLPYLLFSLSILPAVWFWIKPSIKKAFQLKRSLKRLNYLEYNPKIQQLFLQTETQQYNDIPQGIQIGNSDAKNTLSLLLDPNCDACRETYKQANEIHLANQEDIKLNINFFINPFNPATTNELQTAINLLNINQQQPSETSNILDHYMSNKNHKQLAMYSPEKINKETQEQIAKTIEWQFKYWTSKYIMSAPVVFWNNKKIPTYFSHRLPLIKRTLTNVDY